MSGKTSPWPLVLVNVAQFCLEAPQSPEIRASEPVLHSWLTLWSANKMLPVKYVWYLFFCREVTKQTALNDKDRCQSLPSLNAPKNKPNFSCCNWTNSTHPDLQGWQIRTDWGGGSTLRVTFIYITICQCTWNWMWLSRFRTSSEGACMFQRGTRVWRWERKLWRWVVVARTCDSYHISLIKSCGWSPRWGHWRAGWWSEGKCLDLWIVYQILC